MVGLLGVLLAVNSGWAVDLDTFANDFGRTDCTEQTSCQGDLDQDGDTDGLDLANFNGPLNPVVVSFAEVRSMAVEGTIAPVELVINRFYGGSVLIRVSGTADENDHGLSCAGDLCTVSPAGGTIQVPIEDDTEVEVVEWLALRLEPGPGYEVGSVSEHVITIDDNDRVWEGVFTTAGEEVGFTVELIQMDGDMAGHLLPEGSGMVASAAMGLNEGQLAFDVAFDDSAGTFSAMLPELPLAEDQTLLRTPGTFQLVLEASNTTGKVTADQVEGRADLGSPTVMKFRYASQPHLDRDVSGSFVLKQQPATPSDAEVTLENIF
jgi:hypothetical protein